MLAASLSHPGIKLLAEQYHLKIQGLPLDAHGISPEAFDDACREYPVAILYCAPTIHSPTTMTMPEARRMEIADIAKRHDVLIIEDESASFLLPHPPLPISAYAPDRSFFIGDVWMALSLGLRTTYVLTPASLLRSMDSAVASSSGLTTPLVAEIAATWIESGTADRLIEARRAELESRNAIAKKILGKRALHAHPYGHHIWLELPRPWTSELYVVRAEQVGVAINSAEWFAIDHGTIPSAVRVCIGNAPGTMELRWALSTLNRLIDEPRSTSRPAL